jgi:hypothetical protein
VVTESLGTVASNGYTAQAPRERRVEHWWYYNWQGKIERMEKNKCHYHFFYRKSHIEYTDTEPTPL